MDSLEIKSIRALEEEMNVSNAVIGHFLSTDKRSISLLLHLLRTLKYPCNSPEFDLINEIVEQNDLKNVNESSKIQSVKFAKRNRQYSFPTSSIGCAA